jgi:formyltetrahydrofolate-dependent phosphoribosylglycinamide formyltransferase
MFKWLKQHWKVNNKDLVLILCTFCITGISIAWIGRNVTSWLDIESNSLGGWLLRLFVFLIGYQVLILIIGYCFGMFDFFWKYEKKILRRAGLLKDSDINKSKMNQINIAIFASGAGSNAQKIITYVKDEWENKTVEANIALIVTNNPVAGVVKIAGRENIPVLVIERSKFNRDGYINELKIYKIEFIVLAGFMWKIPEQLISAFPKKIVNIHPALLPKYGGKKMYGQYVHEAVLNAGERESGITIHYVDEIYDHGEIIFQAKCPVSEKETAESLAEKVHELEHRYYPSVIEKVLVSSQ